MTEELAAWVPSLGRLSAESRRVYAVFNNCVRNYAVVDAQALAVLLGSESGKAEPEEP